MSGIKKLILIILCIVWMGFIFYNSSNSGNISNERSYNLMNILRGEYREIKGDSNNVPYKKQPVEPSTQNSNNSNKEKPINMKNKVKEILGLSKGNREEKLNVIIRKNAHAFEYFILAFIVACTLFILGLRGKNAIIYIMFICLFYAVTDEFHQQFISGRSSSVNDVVIDFLGSLFGVLLFYCSYYGISRLSGKSKKKF